MVQQVANNPTYTNRVHDTLSKKQNDQVSFSSVLKHAIEDVNKAQVLSDQKTDAFLTGKIDNLHDVMITAQKAGIMLETSVQIQQKAIDGYNEIMRMQI